MYQICINITPAWPHNDSQMAPGRHKTHSETIIHCTSTTRPNSTPNDSNIKLRFCCAEMRFSIDPNITPNTAKGPQHDPTMAPDYLLK